MLHEYVEIFAWSYEDMSGLDTDIVVLHRPPTKEDFPLVKQKVCRMHPDMSEKIKAEVMKQFNTGFLAVTSYLQWVANVVPIPKKDGKVRRCVDYRGLNKASPKDDFPLPHINFWLTTPYNIRYSPSWMVSPGIIRSKWHLRTWRKPPSSHNMALSVKSYAIWTKERRGNLSTCHVSFVSRYDPSQDISLC